MLLEWIYKFKVITFSIVTITKLGRDKSLCSPDPASVDHQDMSIGNI